MATQSKLPTLSIIKEKIGSLGIAKDDIVKIGERGKVWPLEHRQYSYSQSLLQYEIESNQLNIIANEFSKIIFNKQNLDKIILSPIDYQSSILKGLQLQLFDFNYKLKSQVTLIPDTDDLASRHNFLEYLSNGNAVVLWQDGAGGDSYFNIYDNSLTPIAPDTNVGNVPIFSLIALIGGGFVTLSIDGTDLYLSIYSNTGSVVLTATAIDTNVTACSVVQLSNGNIAIAKLKGGVPIISIYTAAGIVVYANLSNNGLIGGVNPKISLSALEGYFCCMSETDGIVSGSVYSNVGQPRNYNNNFIFNGGTATTARQAALVNDGIRFWMLKATLGLPGSSISGFKAVSLNTDGNNANNKVFSYSYNIFNVPTYTTPTPMGFTDVSAFCKNYTICFSYENNIVRFDVNNNLIENIGTISNNDFFAAKIIPTYDCGYLAIGQKGSGTDFNSLQIQEDKYTEIHVLGVSLDTIPVHNENTLISVNITKNGIRCNEVPGKTQFFSRNSEYNLPPGIIFSGSLLLDDNMIASP